MSYENAEPKVTKYLISDGNLVDENGNVIAHSDSLRDMYIKASSQVKKYLLSDGSVVDENNNLIIKNDYFKKMYEQADPKVAKYLHTDGTIDENESSGGSANLQDNKQVDITSNGTVEITPDVNYDGMKKVTANVSVSGGTLYAWRKANDSIAYLSVSVAPADETEYKNVKTIQDDGYGALEIVSMYSEEASDYERISDISFSDIGYHGTTFTRDTTEDLVLWQIS